MERGAWGVEQGAWSVEWGAGSGEWEGGDEVVEASFEEGFALFAFSVLASSGWPSRP